MIVDISNGQIIIKDPEKEFNSVDQSQMSFWGFSLDLLSNLYTVKLDETTFLKIINYLYNVGKHFQFTNKTLEYFDYLKLQEEYFRKLKDEVRKFKDGIFNVSDFEDFRQFVFTNIKRPLKTHQLKAAYHLYRLGNGANFSVPGSGKTSVVLTVYEKLRQEGKINILFVVGPPSCFGAWKDEFILTLGYLPQHKILAGGNKYERKNEYFNIKINSDELYLTTFHSFLYDQEEIESFLDQKEIKVFFVVDEAHYIKQMNGNWANAILKLAEKTKYRCVLTGTPMPKSYTDLYNLFDFLWPNQTPLSQDNKILVEQNEKIGNRVNAKKILDFNIGPLFYRVRKSDLNLSEQNILKPDLIDMNRYERKVYDAIYTRIRDYSKSDYFKNVEIVNRLSKGRIMRLRQSVSYVKLLNKAIINYEEDIFEDLNSLKNIIRNYDDLETSAKIRTLIKKVRVLRISNLKVIIWSNFIDTIKYIKKHLREKGYYSEEIYGAIPIERSTARELKDEETREKRIARFNNPNSGLDILIANPAACAESISLHKHCHHAIYYDLSYNCAQYLQSLDRIHRVGGSEFVEANYHFLQYKNTIDRDIKRNLDIKTQKMFDIIEEDYPIYSLNMFEGDEDEEAYKRLFAKKDKK